VPSPGYGIVYTIHTHSSIAKQQLYEVTVGDFPACTCIDFISMKASALGNGKKKWICCKHIYFILQRFLGCTLEDKFVHCPAWTFNEVQMLLARVEVISSTDWSFVSMLRCTSFLWLEYIVLRLMFNIVRFIVPKFVAVCEDWFWLDLCRYNKHRVSGSSSMDNIISYLSYSCVSFLLPTCISLRSFSSILPAWTHTIWIATAVSD
jgi:hypothetical protein